MSLQAKSAYADSAYEFDIFNETPISSLVKNDMTLGVWIRGAQQDKNKYRIQDEFYRIQYSLASIIVYGPKKQVNCEKYSKIQQDLSVS